MKHPNVQAHKNLPIHLFFLQRRPLGARSVLVTGYNVMQRIAIGLELTVVDLESNYEHYALKKGNFWKLACEAAHRVIEAIYVLLKAEHYPVERLPKLHRSIIDPKIACMASEAGRDSRDFYILKDSVALVQLYKWLFNAFVNHGTK